MKFKTRLEEFEAFMQTWQAKLEVEYLQDPQILICEILENKQKHRLFSLMNIFYSDYVAQGGKDFYEDLKTHIVTYTIPQYGDKPTDQISNWSVNQVLKNILKRLARKGKQKQTTDLLDVLKMSHEVIIVWAKLEDGIENKNNETFPLSKFAEECAECSGAIQSYINALSDKQKKYTEQDIERKYKRMNNEIADVLYLAIKEELKNIINIPYIKNEIEQLKEFFKKD